MAAPAPGWADILSALLRGDDLDPDQAAWAMAEIMSGEATSAQVAGFVVALRAKGETPDEIGGLVAAMLDAAVPLEVDGVVLDVVGTGGDRAHTVNISTMAAVVAAAVGARVVKHGNRAASSKTGTADVLEELGVVIALPADGVRASLDQAGIAFVFAAAFHPAMRHAAVARRELGVPTVFNVLGPLANPARPAAALIGCADARLAPVLADVLASRGTRALVVRGDDGLDELTVFGPSTVYDVTSSEVRRTSLDPRDLGLVEPAAESLRGDDPVFNAAVARAVLGGSIEGTHAAVRDAVALNAAAALVAWDAATGEGRYGPASAPLVERVGAALPEALGAMASGRAGDVLAAWAEATSAYTP